MANTANINVRVDESLKQQAEHIFAELGFNLSTAMTVFLRQAVRVHGIPFDMRLEPDYSLERAISDSLNRENVFGPYKTGAEAIAAALEG